MTKTVEHAAVALAEMAKVIEGLKKELDEAAGFINDYLGEIPLAHEPHNWLIRNGYEDTSYQGDCFGQKLVEWDSDKNTWRNVEDETGESD